MCLECDLRRGIPIAESTGVTYNYRKECERRGIHAENTPEPLLAVTEAVQNVVTLTAALFPSFRPYLAAFFAAYAAELDRED